MKDLKFICVQPSILYYAWQVEVMLNSFLENGIEPNQIHIICSVEPNRMPSVEWSKLKRHFRNVSFFFYEDNRPLKGYVSSVRPYLLSKHFTRYPELTEYPIFYHDCDIVLTQPPKWSHLLEDDIWYLSDTESYISTRYIKSKGHNVYQEMCEVLRIDPRIPVENELSSGGAQYIMKNVTAEFWEIVYEDCEELYKYFVMKEDSYPENYEPIQKWTTDMWAVLWGAWRVGYHTEVVPELDFCWPQNRASRWDEVYIHHNAGVVDPLMGLYHKPSFTNELPYGKNLQIKENTCSYKYYQEIQKTGKKSCII